MILGSAAKSSGSSIIMPPSPGRRAALRAPFFHTRSFFRRSKNRISSTCRPNIPSSPSPDLRRRDDTVKRTFYRDLPPREASQPRIVEGDAFHRFDRPRCATDGTRAAARGTRTSAISVPKGTCSRELETLFRVYGETGTRPNAQVPARRRRGRALRSTAGHIHAVGGRPARLRSAVLRRAARRGGTDIDRRLAATPISRRRRADRSISNGFRSCTATRPRAATRTNRSSIRSCAGCPIT